MAKIRCKKCGHMMIADIIVSDMPEQSGYNITPRQTFKQTIPGITPTSPAMFEGYDYEKRQPAREPSLQGDVLVPAAQSLLTGLALGIPSAAVMGMLGYDTTAALATGAAVGLSAISVTWLIKMDAHSRLLWLVESVTGRDIDGDDEVGEPEPVARPEPVRLEVVNEDAPGKFAGLNIDLPVGVDRGLFAHWAAMVVNNGMPTGRTHWTGAGRPFSRELYDRFLVALETAGIIHDYGDGKGRVLTTGGKHSLKRFLRPADTLPPTV
jgi:hypothetical protein